MDKDIDNSSTPTVSVLMCVYNGEKYLAAAVQSILEQTFSCFEFIIVNDGSSDNTSGILSSFTDPRMVIINNHRNEGLIASLNKGLAEAKGKFIARMDADDISVPVRLEKQVNFLNSEPSVGVCGSWLSIIGKNKNYEFPVSHHGIKAAMMNDNPMAHPSVMFRNDIFRQYQLKYDSRFPGAEDYELWSRAIFTTRFANIPETLVQYRLHDQQVTNTGNLLVKNSSAQVKLNFINRFNIYPDGDQAGMHLFLFNHENARLRQPRFLKHADEWLYQIFLANQKLAILQEEQLCGIWRTKLFVTAIKQYDLTIWHILYHSKCFRFGRVSAAQKIRLFVKCLVKKRVGI